MSGLAELRALPRPTAGRAAPLRLSPEERRRVEAGRWFAALPAALREDILGCGVARRYRDGWSCTLRGGRAEAWMCVARGAVRLSASGVSGRSFSLAYLKPGSWFGDVALFDGGAVAHDAQAHGDTTLLCIGGSDFHTLLARHPALLPALLQLNCRRLRALFERLEDSHTLPLATRLARQLQRLLASHGRRETAGLRIGLRLTQDELAQMIGASRQRVNQALRGLERAGVLDPDPRGILVLDVARLAAVASDGTEPEPDAASGARRPCRRAA